MSPRWNALLGVGLVFVLGCAAGAIGFSVFAAHRATLFLQRGAPAYVEVLERRFTRGLHLDSQQKEQIHDVFMENLEHRKQVQQQIQPQIMELNTQTVRQIRTILHPDQMETFRANVQDFRRRFGRNRVNPSALDAAGLNSPSDASTNSAPAPVNP